MHASLFITATCISLQISKLEYKQMLPNSPILFFHNEQQHLKENDDF